MCVEPVAYLFGHVGIALEGIVLAETEAATGTAGCGRDNQRPPVVLLDDAIRLARGQVAHRVVYKSGDIFAFGNMWQDFA